MTLKKLVADLQSLAPEGGGIKVTVDDKGLSIVVTKEEVTLEDFEPIVDYLDRNEDGIGDVLMEIAERELDKVLDQYV